MGQFARWLPDFGWDVTVLTARKSSRAAIDGVALAALGTEVQVIETRAPTSMIDIRGSAVGSGGLRGGVRRALKVAMRSLLFPDREVLWVPGAIAAGRRALGTQRFDAVLATYGPASNLLVGHALARSAGIPLVLDFRDLWSTLPMPVFASAAHRLLARRVERWLVRDAAAVIGVAPAMAEHLVDVHGLPPDAGVSITNGFDPGDVAAAQDRRDLHDTTRPFRLVYTGSLHEHYDREPLWAALRALAAGGKITPETFRVEIVGNLAASEPQRAGVSQFVEIHPFVPHAGVFDVLGRADAMLLFETPGYYATFGYAGKVFDYVLTGKPVLALVEAGGNTARLLASLGVGHFAAPGDVATTRAAIEAVLALRGAAPRPVDPEASPLRSYNRRHLTERLAGVLDSAVDRRRGSPRRPEQR